MNNPESFPQSSKQEDPTEADGPVVEETDLERDRRIAYEKGVISAFDTDGNDSVLLLMGLTREGKSASPEEWIKMFEGRYDPERDRRQNSEFYQNMLRVAQKDFGSGGRSVTSANTKLLKELEEKLRSSHGVAIEEEVEEDPFKGTAREGVPDEQLLHGITVPGLNGKPFSSPGDPSYRLAVARKLGLFQ